MKKFIVVVLSFLLIFFLDLLTHSTRIEEGVVIKQFIEPLSITPKHLGDEYVIVQLDDYQITVPTNLSFKDGDSITIIYNRGLLGILTLNERVL